MKRRILYISISSLKLIEEDPTYTYMILFGFCSTLGRCLTEMRVEEDEGF